MVLSFVQCLSRWSPWVRLENVQFPNELCVHSDVLSWVLFLRMFCCLSAAVKFSAIPAFIFCDFWSTFSSVMSW